MSDVLCTSVASLFLFFYFPKMCSLSLRINAHMKHAYKMFYNMIDYGITDWSVNWYLKICNDCCWIRSGGSEFHSLIDLGKNELLY